MQVHRSENRSHKVILADSVPAASTFSAFFRTEKISVGLCGICLLFFCIAADFSDHGMAAVTAID